MEKKGQVTIFIILAILLVGIVVLVYQFYPQIKQSVTGEESSPQKFIQDCLEDKLKEVKDQVAIQGGELEPELYYPYHDNKVHYLCFTKKNYALCTMQTTALKKTIQDSIKQGISEKAEQCFSDLKDAYESKGYDVSLDKRDFNVEIAVDRVIADFDYTFTATKGSTEIYKDFEVGVRSRLFLLMSIAEDILNKEATLGMTDTGLYMMYKDLRIQHNGQLDGTTIYTLTDKLNNEVFQFASRSMTSYPGY